MMAQLAKYTSQVGCRGAWLYAAIAMLGASSQVFAQGAGDYGQYSRRIVAGLEPEFARVTAKYVQDPGVVALRERLSLIDEVAALMARRFESYKSSTLQGLLKDVDMEMAPKMTPASRPGTLTASAAEILAQYSDGFLKGLASPSMKEEELAVVRQYYDVKARAAGKYIAESGQYIAAVKKDAKEVVELCLVMPFLHVSDDEWSATEVESLPEWLRSQENCATARAFALLVRRPFTAYHFDLRRRRLSKEKECGYVEFLTSAAEELIKAREYPGAVLCLKKAIEAAEKTGDSQAGLRLKLAELLDKIGHTQLAAEEVKAAMEKNPKSPEWGKMAMLRLKYLYTAGQYVPVCQEGPAFQEDGRCQEYLPQILYIAWVTNRHESKTEEAEKLQKLFLAKFPGHPLGADMHFASAMMALAAGNYEEAKRLLEIIEYRYPDSKILPKAREIRARLEQTAKPAPSTRQASPK